MTRIAHLSDLHLVTGSRVELRRLLCKRLTGWANLRLRREALHRREPVRDLVEAIREDPPDHVVLTGDLVNLSLEDEFERCRDFLSGLGLSADRVTMVPGNHDVYTRGSHRAARFASYFAQHMTSDVPVEGAFPFVRLRGGVAIVGLRSALPRLPFVASGAIGTGQLARLRRLLEEPEVRDRLVVVLVHHPPFDPPTRLRRLVGGLADASLLVDVLSVLPRVLVLHGHLHRRSTRALRSRGGMASLRALGAPSASLVAPDHACRAGYNEYEIAPDGTVSVRTCVWEGEGRIRWTDGGSGVESEALTGVAGAA